MKLYVCECVTLRNRILFFFNKNFVQLAFVVCSRRVLYAVACYKLISQTNEFNFIGIYWYFWINELNNDWLWWFYAILKYDNVENCGTRERKIRTKINWECRMNSFHLKVYFRKFICLFESNFVENKTWKKNIVFRIFDFILYEEPLIFDL